MSNTYVLRAENGKLAHHFKEGGFASMGWFKDSVDFDISLAKDITYIKERVLESNPNYNTRRIGHAAGKVFRFINENVLILYLKWPSFLE